MYCQKCGKNLGDSNVCTSCKKEPKKNIVKSKKKIIVVILSVMVISVAVFFAYNTLFSNSGTSKGVIYYDSQGYGYYNHEMENVDDSKKITSNGYPLIEAYTTGDKYYFVDDFDDEVGNVKVLDLSAENPEETQKIIADDFTFYVTGGPGIDDLFYFEPATYVTGIEDDLIYLNKESGLFYYSYEDDQLIQITNDETSVITEKGSSSLLYIQNGTLYKLEESLESTKIFSNVTDHYIEGNKLIAAISQQSAYEYDIETEEINKIYERETEDELVATASSLNLYANRDDLYFHSMTYIITAKTKVTISPISDILDYYIAPTVLDRMEKSSKSDFADNYSNWLRNVQNTNAYICSIYMENDEINTVLTEDFHPRYLDDGQFIVSQTLYDSDVVVDLYEADVVNIFTQEDIYQAAGISKVFIVDSEDGTTRLVSLEEGVHKYLADTMVLGDELYTCMTTDTGNIQVFSGNIKDRDDLFQSYDWAKFAEQFMIYNTEDKTYISFFNRENDQICLYEKNGQELVTVIEGLDYYPTITANGSIYMITEEGDLLYQNGDVIETIASNVAQYQVTNENDIIYSVDAEINSPLYHYKDGKHLQIAEDQERFVAIDRIEFNNEPFGLSVY